MSGSQTILAEENESNLKIGTNKLIIHDNKSYTFRGLVGLYLKQSQNVNHKIYRKIIKKVERKYYRQQSATFKEQLQQTYERIESRPLDKDNLQQISIDYEAEAKLEKQQESEKLKSEKEHQLWLRRERQAQIEWKVKKEKQEKEMMRFKEKQAKREKQEKEISQKKSKNEAPKINESEPEQPTHNPYYPYQYIPGDEDSREKCNFFIKTGVCKYGNTCTRSHLINNSNEPLTTLIFPGMYMNMLLGYELLKLDAYSDEALEYEENDIVEHYNMFYADVVDELKTYGEIVQFLVCSNYELHLRGNVYVQYEKEEYAIRAYRELNGRYYAGKQIYCYFTHVKNWKDAVCGLFLRKKCSKGQKCHFMHVFQNPRNEYPISEFKPIKSYIKNVPNDVKSIAKSYVDSNKSKTKNNWSSDDDEASKKENKWDDDDFISSNKKKSTEQDDSKERTQQGPNKKKLRVSDTESSKKHKSRKKSKSRHDNESHRHHRRHKSHSSRSISGGHRS